MACTRPLTAYRSIAGPNKDGKWPIVWSIHKGYVDMPVKLPCGQCIGCRLEKSRQWAIRCVNEASMYKDNCFVTLTYREENIPKDGSINKEVVQKFMKRLRKKFSNVVNPGIRYFLCGEYGEQFKRPHYHLCLFNFDFPDKVLWTIRENNELYRSEILEKIWKEGYSIIGQVTWESAAYVARYITKKITGDISSEHYKNLMPEFALMSRKPGIGSTWYEKWKDDVKSTDKVIVRNDLQIRPPKYYYSKWEIEDIESFKKAKERRLKDITDLDIDERAYLENVQESRFKSKNRRSLEKCSD